MQNQQIAQYLIPLKTFSSLDKTPQDQFPLLLAGVSGITAARVHDSFDDEYGTKG